MKQLEMNRLRRRRKYLCKNKRLLINALKNLSIRDWIGSRGSVDQNAADGFLITLCLKKPVVTRYSYVKKRDF